MKKEDIVLLAIVAVSVFAVARMFQKPTSTSTAQQPANSYNATEIMRDNGWVYYSDGTAIGPDGKYYYQGSQVYDPKGMYQ